MKMAIQESGRVDFVRLLDRIRLVAKRPSRSNLRFDQTFLEFLMVPACKYCGESRDFRVDHVQLEFSSNQESLEKDCPVGTTAEPGAAVVRAAEFV